MGLFSEHESHESNELVFTTTDDMDSADIFSSEHESHESNELVFTTTDDMDSADIFSPEHESHESDKSLVLDFIEGLFVLLVRFVFEIDLSQKSEFRR